MASDHQEIHSFPIVTRYFSIFHFTFASVMRALDIFWSEVSGYDADLDLLPDPELRLGECRSIAQSNIICAAHRAVEALACPPSASS
jgi:hypothetical protein